MRGLNSPAPRVNQTPPRWRLTGEAIRASIRRPSDFAARYGGEEFAVIMPNTDEAGAEVVATLIRTAVLALSRQHSASDKGAVTVSIGVASIGPDDFELGGKALVDRADKALYRAKSDGRNLVRLAPSAVHE